MAAAEEWAARRGLPFVTLGTGAANQQARGLYAALGYREELVELTKRVAEPRNHAGMGAEAGRGV